MKKIIIALVLIFCTSNVLAENQSVKLDIIIPENITMGLVYDSLFKITNLDYVKGVDSKINVTINYNITKNEIVIYSANFSRIVNSFSTASTGFLFIDESGNYILCGQTENSSACKTFNVIDPNDIICNATLKTSIEKNVFENHERFEIKNKITFNDDKEYPYIMEYWIEDLFGFEIKKKINTTNDNDKTFTSDIDEKTAVYLLKSRLVYVGCNNLIGKTESETMFAIKNQEYEQISLIAQKINEENNEKTNQTLKKSNAEIYSFYTRSKKYKPEINIYANLKGDGEATVIFYSSKREQIRKVELPAKPVFLGEAEVGSNKYILELYINGDLIDSRNLIVNLEGEDPVKKPIVNKTKNVTKIASIKKPVSIPKNIFIQENKTEDTQLVLTSTKSNEINQAEVKKQENAIFESSSKVQKNAAPAIGIGVLILVAIGVVLFKK